jgi:hypothetical protein
MIYHVVKGFFNEKLIKNYKYRKFFKWVVSYNLASIFSGFLGKFIFYRREHTVIMRPSRKWI